MDIPARKQQFFEHLYDQGTTPRQWAIKNNLHYHTVISIFSGSVKGQFGKARQVRLAIEKELTNINA
ncbi:hypothetical protein [Acinetobacter puyangensis]|uniref:hypothetical protein n=1 Tax=Acinetobacter puyangensis TaxID=1096779 RepID=UPI003A4D496C